MSTRVPYLYGVMRAEPPVADATDGIDAESPVECIPCGSLAAITSDVELAAFESDGPSDPAWIVPRALRHEHVVEWALARGPVMPVRFGSLFQTRAALVAWVASNAPQIGSFLDRVADKDEWSLRIGRSKSEALENLLAREGEWASRAAGLPDAPGARYFQEKRLRADADRYLRETARAAALRLRSAVSVLADEQTLAPRAGAPPDIEPLFHLAYLVPRQVLASFQSTIDDAGRETPWLRLETSGPWPAAHFCPRLPAPQTR